MCTRWIARPASLASESANSWQSMITSCRFAIVAALAVIGLAASAAGDTASAVVSKPFPNILFILADDLGYGDVGCYNPEAKVPTPNLDRLAKEGLRFTDAHSPSTVCTPSRYSMLTGRMAFRYRHEERVQRSGRTLPDRAGAAHPAGNAPRERLYHRVVRQVACRHDLLRQGRSRIRSGDIEGVKRIDLLARHPRCPDPSRLRPVFRHGVLSDHRLALCLRRWRPRARSAHRTDRQGRPGCPSIPIRATAGRA